MIIRAIHAFVLALGNLSFFLGCFEHCYDEVSLTRDHGLIDELFLIEFDQDFVGFDAFVDTLDHRKVVRAATVVLVVVEEDIFDEV